MAVPDAAVSVPMTLDFSMLGLAHMAGPKFARSLIWLAARRHTECDNGVSGMRWGVHIVGGKAAVCALTRECRSAHVYEWWCALDTLGQGGRCCTLKDQVLEK